MANEDIDDGVHRGEPLAPAKDPVILAHAERIRAEIGELQGDTAAKVRALLGKVFADEQIQTEYSGALIRYTAMCAAVAREILRAAGLRQNLVNSLTIGSVDLPPQMRKVTREFLRFAASLRESLMDRDGTGYDLSAKGSLEARKALVSLFDIHYGFSRYVGFNEALAENMAITAGGMRTLQDIALAMIERADKKGERNRFIFPDNSFSTWWDIARIVCRDNNVTADRKVIHTKQENLLHLTAEQVRDFYNREGKTDCTRNMPYHDTWYITPVANPSGTMIPSDQLAAVCEAIVTDNPDAVIILDSVYVRLLKPEQAQKLMNAVLRNPYVRKRIIFVESFSKSHGLCRQRVGAYFSENPEIFGVVQNLIMKVSAGQGDDKSALALALAAQTPAQQQAIDDLHEFWAKGRRGLHAFLMQERFAHLFDEKQSHITQDQLQNPGSLYLFLKLKPGITGRQVAVETGCLGVETPMRDRQDIYIRFAVGMLTEPTFAQYIPDADTGDGCSGEGAVPHEE